MPNDDNGERQPWVPAPWTRLGRAEKVLDPLQTPYGWVTQEVPDALNSITLGDTRKRRTTILMIADAVASGNREIQEVLEDPLTLGHAGWYQRVRTDPEFEKAYKFCLEAAHAWYDQLESRRLARRASQVERAKDELVSLTEQAIRVMADLLLDDNVPASIRRGIVTDILDRASDETATKVNATVTAGTPRAPSMRDLRRDRPKSITEASVEVGAQLEVGEDEGIVIEAADGAMGD
jgi:hypothetical protein